MQPVRQCSVFEYTRRDLNGVRVADVQSSGGNRDVGSVCGAEGSIQVTVGGVQFSRKRRDMGRVYAAEIGDI